MYKIVVLACLCFLAACSEPKPVKLPQHIEVCITTQGKAASLRNNGRTLPVYRFYVIRDGHVRFDPVSGKGASYVADYFNWEAYGCQMVTMRALE